VEPLRHRQTKGAATDMFYLMPPRHISTLPNASFRPCPNDFRSTPISRPFQGPTTCLKRAITGLMHRSKQHLYSITSSARTSNEGGTVRPSALAVFMLITSSNLVGCSTGRSEGLVPLRILST